MKTIAAIIATIALLITWASGIMIVPSLICLVLKLVGVPFLAGMSAWFPLQVFGVFVSAGLVTVVSGVMANSHL